MERALSPRRQGDLGEASAIDWLTRQGAVVFAPIGHSPDVDLIALHRDSCVRVQVKTTVSRSAGPTSPWRVGIATRGGNRTWDGTVKFFDAGRADVLFVLAGDGRRWAIPTARATRSSKSSLPPRSKSSSGGPPTNL